MSRNIMNIEIRENNISIKINKKLHELSIDEMLEIFSIISVFVKNESKKGNDCEKAWIKIKYIEGIVINEYINILKLIRFPNLYDFINHFTSIERKFSSQNTETRLNLDDYFQNSEEISQEILVTMIFPIETELKKLKKESNKLIKVIKHSKINEEISNLFKKH